MAKTVLGNDPFLRGAPVREPTDRNQHPPAQPAKALEPVIPSKVGGRSLPKKAAEPKRPLPARQWPTAAGKNEPARSSVRGLMSTPTQVPTTPKPPLLDQPPGRLRDWEPQSHPDAPELLALLQARMKQFVAHPNTPELKAVLGPDATAHAHSPEVIADLDEDTAISHPLSPEVVEVRSPSPHQPVVVEVVETTEPGMAMGDREISPQTRSSSPALALGVAREIFSGGIARPLAGAARGLFHAARTALGVGAGTELDVWGKDLALARSLGPLSDFLYERYFRVTVDGADHLPAGASLLIANHSGALPLDGPMLYLALQRERADLPGVRWLIEDQVFHAPFVGVLANRLGAVRANPENATRLLEEKRPVAVFPEGIHGISKRFSQRYQLKRFGRGGYVKLAVRLNVPIVPVAIVGAEESMPLLARLPGGFLGLPYLPITPPPLPARWHIRFGPPIDLSQAPDNAEEDLAWVARTNDRTRETVEGMLTSMLRSRSSVF